MSTAECGDAHEGGKGEGGSYTEPFERIQKKERRQRAVQFSEDLQTFMYNQLRLAALQKSKIKIKDPKISIICPLQCQAIYCKPD